MWREWCGRDRMRIMVFNVAAEYGGALSVLHDYYNKFTKDEENEYVFILSTPDLQEVKNIKVIRFPWIKNSWLHRLFFDYFISHKLIKKFKIDRVLSLQNTIIPLTNIKQSVLIQNSLPFTKYKFTIIEDTLIWIYQNIIGKKIKKSIKKADHVIVQTDWMKRNLIEQLQLRSDKIEVQRPNIQLNATKVFEENKKNLSTFFYPASGLVYKNHILIVNTCLRLKEEAIEDYKVIFTLNGSENRHISKLYKIVKQNELPIEFVGVLEKEVVNEYYSKTVLLFPSYIETIGLPLLEAKMHKTPIIVSDCEYAHEALNDYETVDYFNPFDLNSIKNCLLKKLRAD
jgi:glycosyltransferase involved in cell wall biosynthesis